MSDEEMMKATLEGAGPRPVPAGKVRRKKLAYLGSGSSDGSDAGSADGSGSDGSGGEAAGAAEPAAAAAAAVAGAS